MPASVHSENPGDTPLPPAATPDLRGARIREFRNNFDLQRVLNSFGPAIHGLASSFFPNNSASAENITIAVLELFRRKVRKLPKRAFAAVWLFQTAVIAARRERRRSRLPSKPASPVENVILGLYRLTPTLRNAVILSEIFGIAFPKVVTKSNRGTARLRRKTGEDAQSILRNLALPLPSSVVETLQAPPAERPLVRLTSSSWRWINFLASIKRILATIGGTACFLAIMGLTFHFLATRGYLMPIFFKMGQRQVVKEFPEMLIPPRPWPVTPADRATAKMTPPRDSEELFRLTNIWPITLSFTAREWDRMQPSRVAPVRHMFTEGRIILRNPQAKRSGLSGVVGFEFNWARADLSFASQELPNAGVRFRGNGTFLNSLYGPKQSLKLDVNKFEKAHTVAGVHEINFLNAVVDYSYLHDSLGQQLFRELGVVGPRTAYAYITVRIDDKVEPRGLFVAVENIDDEFAKDRFGTKKAPIFKPVTYELFENLGDNWTAYAAIYDLKTKATPEQEQRVIEFAKLVSHATDEAFARKLPDYLDLDEFAGFLAGHVLLSSYDGFLVNGQNYYVYLDPRSNKFGFVSWDQDHAWGDFGHVGTTEQREDASIWHPSTYDFRFLNRVLRVDAFKDIYRQKLESALTSSFSKERLYAEVDRVAECIRPAVAAESDFRLGRFDKAVSSEWLPGSRDGEAEGPKAPVHQIKRFIENRIRSVRDQLDGKSEGTRLGFP